MKIAEALRLLRTRQGLTQTAASKLEGAPDFRVLSHWETRRKMPSLRLLHNYLSSLGLDFADLQEALHQVEGSIPKRLADRLETLERRLEALDQRLRAATRSQEGPEDLSSPTPPREDLRQRAEDSHTETSLT